MTPSDRYQQDLNSQKIQPDVSQAQAIQSLDDLYHALVEQGARRPWWKSVWRGQRSGALIKGVYFWGGVGRGKTYIMDLFFESLPFERKMRTHFHRFMGGVHQSLQALKDQKDPLKIVAKDLASKARIICFDEFFVSDITDAMLLAGLLEALFDLGVVFVTTSNIEPDGLYKDGLQRARFLPAIKMLNEKMQIINLDGGVDYRLRTLKALPLFHSPLNTDSDRALDGLFKQLVVDQTAVVHGGFFQILGRDIPCRARYDDIAWFEFSSLCEGARSQRDYIQLASECHTVILSGVPPLGRKNDDAVRRFIYLVDEFYDRAVKLVISSERPMLDMYSGGALGFEFQRTLSRLQEMQSEQFLAKAHKI